MLSFIDPVAVSHRSLGPGLSNNLCGSTWCGAIWGFLKGLSLHKTPQNNQVLCSFTLDIKSSIKNLSRDIPTLCTRFTADANVSSLECSVPELMDSGRERCFGRLFSRFPRHPGTLPPAPTAPGANRWDRKERAAYREEKVEKGKRRGRKQRGYEATAVKWQGENDDMEALPCTGPDLVHRWQEK